MTTWSLEQVRSARSLRVKGWLDAALLSPERHDETRGAMRDKLFKALQHMAHPYAVELDPRDVEFSQWNDPATPWQATFGARWNPATNACELRGGGAHDGEVLELQRPGDPIRLSFLETSPLLLDDGATAATHAEVVLSKGYVQYELAGWSETNRRWVYEAKA